MIKKALTIAVNAVFVDIQMITFVMVAFLIVSTANRCRQLAVEYATN